MTTATHSISAGAAATVERLMQAAFDRPRDLRSDAYKQGTRALLVARVSLTNLVCRHQPGTAEFDAFYAGVEEGKAIWHGQPRKADQ